MENSVSIPDAIMMSKAIVGGGCFWCVEALLQRLKGVQKVESGYAAGHVLNPTYKQVCSGTTGHAEVVRVYYDPLVLPYKNLIYIFMHIHDPTTPNAQGHDHGTQYRSIILYDGEEELATIKTVFEQISKEGKYPGSPAKFATQVSQAKDFYVAEEHHQNYYNEHTGDGYCHAVIKPKMGKFKALFEKYIDQTKL